MTDTNSRQNPVNRPDMENKRLDLELDAALGKYAAIEPRTGLEERILVNLWAEQVRAAERSWWRWPRTAAVAAVVVVALALAWRSGKSLQNIAVHRPSTTQAKQHAGVQVANNGQGGTIQTHQERTRRPIEPHPFRRSVALVAAAPKLDQFPSPQPLSEQEAMLAGYVTKYPEHAALIARARTEELRQDSAEELAEAASAGVENSQQWTKKEDQ